MNEQFTESEPNYLAPFHEGMTTTEAIIAEAKEEVRAFIANHTAREDDSLVVDVSDLELDKLLDVRARIALITEQIQFDPAVIFGVSAGEFDVLREVVTNRTDELAKQIDS